LREEGEKPVTGYRRDNGEKAYEVGIGAWGWGTQILSRRQSSQHRLTQCCWVRSLTFGNSFSRPCGHVYEVRPQAAGDCGEGEENDRIFGLEAEFLEQC
jgi:hypothetical protein